MFEPKLTQVIVEFKLKSENNFFNMKYISQTIGDVIFDSNFSGLKIRIKNSNASIIFFTCGFGRVFGVNSIEGVEEAIHSLRRKLQYCGYRTRLIHTKVISMTATLDLKQNFKLLSQSLKGLKANISEKFSGISIYLNDMTVIVFYNGKINFLGAKNFEQIVITKDILIQHFVNKNSISI